MTWVEEGGAAVDRRRYQVGFPPCVKIQRVTGRSMGVLLECLVSDVSREATKGEGTGGREFKDKYTSAKGNIKREYKKYSLPLFKILAGPQNNTTTG